MEHSGLVIASTTARARGTFLAFCGAVCVALGFVVFAEPASARGFGFLDELANAGRRHADLDAPPAERASALFESMPDEAASEAIYIGSSADRTIQAVTASGAVHTFDTPQQLLDELDRLRKRLVGPDEGTVIFAEADYFRIRPLLVESHFDGRARVVLNNGDVVPLHRVDGPEGPELAIEARPGLLFSGKDGEELAAFRRTLRVSFEPHDSRVLSLFAELDGRTRAAMDDAAGELHVDLAGASAEKVLAQVMRLEHRIVVVVGHIEGDEFVIRQPDSRVSLRLDIAKLEATAREVEANLILLGCDAATVSRSSGLTTPTRDIEVARNLRSALTAQDYGEFLSAFSDSTAPLLVRSVTIRGQDRIFEAHRARAERGRRNLVRAVGSVTVAGRSAAIVAERRSRLLPFLPSILHQLYVAGFVIALFVVRSLWREWLSLWPVAPSITSASSRVIRAARLIAFVAVFPIIGVALLFALPLALGLFFIPFVPWSASFELLQFVEKAPFRCIKRITRILRAGRATVARGAG